MANDLQQAPRAHGNQFHQNRQREETLDLSEQIVRILLLGLALGYTLILIN